MKLSIVTTLYYSAPYLDEFYRRITVSALNITSDYEIIYVNDGSPDQAFEHAIKQQQNDSKLILVDLSRNFGHHQAGMTGLAQARGDYVFLIDCDLEEAPELLEKFWDNYFQHKNLDVLYGVQESRKGNWFEQASGSFFYSLFNYLSTDKIPRNLLTIRLMNKRFVKALLKYQEKALFLGGLMSHAGFDQRAITVKKSSRPNRSYTLSKQLSLFFTSIIAFSSKPLFFILYLGLLIIALTTLTVMGLLLFSTTVITELQIILLSLGFVCGIIVSCIGLLGVYMAKIHEEVKQRPRTIIKQIYR